MLFQFLISFHIINDHAQEEPFAYCSVVPQHTVLPKALSRAHLTILSTAVDDQGRAYGCIIIIACANSDHYFITYCDLTMNDME